MYVKSGIQCYATLALMRAIAGVVALGAACGNAFGQGADDHAPDLDHMNGSAMNGAHLGVSLNGGIGSWRDDLLVPLGFDGPAVALGAEYSYRDPRNLVRAHLRIGAAYITNRFSHEALALRFELRPSWLRTIGIGEGLGEFRAGVAFPVQINDLFLASWDDAHMYWLASYGVGPALEWRKNVAEGSAVQVHLQAPLLSLISRPPSYRHNKQDAMTEVGFFFSEPQRALHLEGPDSYRAFLARAIYSRRIGSSLLNLGLEFDYNYYTEPETIRGLNSSIVLAYLWRI